VATERLFPQPGKSCCTAKAVPEGKTTFLPTLSP